MMKRNVIVILCDQLRPDFLPVYGCTALATPNIDRLVKNGVVFDRAITQSPVCAPSRASMMTGRFVSDHGVWTNDVPFRDGLDYLPERMNDLGYETAAFGKLHHFPAADVKGFQFAQQMEERRLGDQDHYLQWLKKQQPDVTEIWNHHDLQFDFPEEFYYEHWIASEAIDFVEREQKRPFFAWVSFQGPHTPYDPPAVVKGSVDVSKLPQPITDQFENLSSVAKYRSVVHGYPHEDEVMAIREAYGEMIVALDRQIGRILDTVKALGLLDTTSFIFAADHGDLIGDHFNNFKGPFPYAAQLDIPLVVANHPDVQPGTRCQALVGNIDIPGTVLDIAGDERSIGLSRSLLEQLQNTSQQRDVNFSEFCDSIKIVENGRYRFAFYPFTGEIQLFNLEADPEQRQNLVDQPEHARLIQRFLMDIVEFGLLAKGVRVEAQDFVPQQQAGVAAKHPRYQDDFIVAHPIPTRAKIEALAAAGLDTTYNEFCIGKELASGPRKYWG